MYYAVLWEMTGTEQEVAKLRADIDRELAGTQIEEFNALDEMRKQMGLAPPDRSLDLQGKVSLIEQMRQFGRSDNPDGGSA